MHCFLPRLLVKVLQELAQGPEWFLFLQLEQVLIVAPQQLT